MFGPIVGMLNRQKVLYINCLPRGRHSKAAHEKSLLCAQKCTRGGVGYVGVGKGGRVMQGWGGSCRGGVGHVGVGKVMQGWGGSCRCGVGWVMQGWGGVGHVGVGWGWVM